MRYYLSILLLLTVLIPSSAKSWGVIGMGGGSGVTASSLKDTYKARVEADGGSVISEDDVTAFYQMIIDNSIATTDVVIAYSPTFGIKKDGSNKVSKLYNIGSSSFDAVQTTADNQAVYTTNQQNSKPTIIFDGSNDYLSAGNPTDLRSNGSWFAVACGNASIAAYSSIIEYQNSSTTHTPYINLSANGATPRLYRTVTQPANATYYSEGDSAISASTSTYHLIDGTYDSNWLWTYSKVDNVNTSISSSNNATGTAAILYVGYSTNYSSTNTSWMGGIGDVYCFKSLDATKQAAVRTFLNTKFALY